MVDIEERKVIVVAIDDSPQAEQAFRQVAAKNDRSTTIYHLVHVRPDHTEYAVDALYAFKKHWEKLEEARKAASRAILEHYKQLGEELQVQHVEVEKEAALLVRNATSAVGKVLCDYAKAVKAGQLVVAPHGKGMLHSLMGSVGVYCTRHASCPVLLTGPIPTEEGDEEPETAAIAIAAPGTTDA